MHIKTTHQAWVYRTPAFDDASSSGWTRIACRESCVSKLSFLARWSLAQPKVTVRVLAVINEFFLHQQLALQGIPPVMLFSK